MYLDFPLVADCTKGLIYVVFVCSSWFKSVIMVSKL